MLKCIYVKSNETGQVCMKQYPGKIHKHSLNSEACFLPPGPTGGID